MQATWSHHCGMWKLFELPERIPFFGSIYWADLDPSIGHEQAGYRPVLIISQIAIRVVE